MSIVLDLTPTEEANLSTLAIRGGVAPEEMAARLVRQGLEKQTASSRSQVLAKLHKWQKDTGTATTPHVPGSELFQRWAEEDANMTEEEKQRETEIWDELEKGMSQNRLTIGGQPE